MKRFDRGRGVRHLHVRGRAIGWSSRSELVFKPVAMVQEECAQNQTPQEIAQTAAKLIVKYKLIVKNMSVTRTRVHCELRALWLADHHFIKLFQLARLNKAVRTGSTLLALAYSDKLMVVK